MSNIWQTLKLAKKPFFALAPLDDVTDTVFRQIVAKAGQPDLFFTEFINADAYVRGGEEVVEPKLRFGSSERPLIAQIWGKDPVHYEALAARVVQLGFDGVDINMGCPEKNIVKNGCGAGMIRQPERAVEIIAAVKRGAGKLPVSVKTRLGYDKIITEEWASLLLEQGIAALTIHGRTAKEMSKVPAHWDEIAKVVKLRDQIAPQTIIIGNGDVASLAQGEELAEQTGVDGVMIGRGIFHNIFIFDTSECEHTATARFELLLNHLDLHERQWQGIKRYEPLKKFFKIYVNGFDGAAKVRAELMETSTCEQARVILTRFMTERKKLEP